MAPAAIVAPAGLANFGFEPVDDESPPPPFEAAVDSQPSAPAWGSPVSQKPSLKLRQSLAATSSTSRPYSRQFSTESAAAAATSEVDDMPPIPKIDYETITLPRAVAPPSLASTRRPVSRVTMVSSSSVDGDRKLFRTTSGRRMKATELIGRDAAASPPSTYSTMDK